MTALVDTPQAQTDVKPCVLLLLAPLDFDVPCWCNRASSNCTRKEDGSCD